MYTRTISGIINAYFVVSDQSSQVIIHEIELSNINELFWNQEWLRKDNRKGFMPKNIVDNYPWDQSHRL